MAAEDIKGKRRGNYAVRGKKVFRALNIILLLFRWVRDIKELFAHYGSITV